MADCFASLPDVSSEIVGTVEGRNFVALYERVTWSAGEKRSVQSSMAVYETRDGLIAPVWYFPSERGTPAE